MQKGVVGATNLNLALQAALNPTGDGLRRSGYIFRVNDKVMQIRNNYDKEIFNGDIGIVASVDIQGRTLQVDFDGHLIEYDASELDELVHAYATTIHKAQGSEYPIGRDAGAHESLCHASAEPDLYRHHESKENTGTGRNEESHFLRSTSCNSQPAEYAAEGKAAGRNTERNR